MLGTLRNLIFLSWAALFLCIAIAPCHAQESQIGLKSYLLVLEQRFDIKFSYVDEDLEKVEITTPSPNSLHDILESIRAQTQIKIEKLNDRYYTLSKNTLIHICGRVLDNFAENTVSAASIEVLGSKIALVTDSEGLFAVNDIPRDALLKVRFLGYVTKYIPAESLIVQDDCPHILLAQNYELLEEVIVYEFLAPGIIKQKDASITLNTGKLGILPGMVEPDVLQTVQALPGIKSINETVSDINVRGGTNDQNLILWNGIKMYQSGHFFGLISAFNPYLTDKVTVYKNGTPANYGDGVSSVINMETKNEIDDLFTGGAGINFISGDVYGQIPLKNNLALQFSARRSTTDFLNTPTYSNFTDRAFQDSEVKNEQNQSINENFVRDETFFFYDFSGKLLYNINDDHKLRLSFIAIANDLEFTETNLDIDETTLSLLDQTNLSSGIQLESNWTNKLSSNLNIYYSKYNLDAQSLFSNQVQILFQNNRVTENALKLNTNYVVSERLDWTNGYQFIETGIKNFTQISQPNFLSNITGVIRIHAPYTAIGYTANENQFMAQVGVRANYIENLATFNKLFLEPRLNLNFKVANYLRAEILGEFKSQSTNQVIDLEQNFLGIEKRRWIISDGNGLPITKSKQGSLGFNYAKNELYIGLEGFYKHVDGISTRTQGFQSENQFNGEIGSYEVKGLEFLINKKADNYSAWLSYTLNYNDYTFGTIDPSTFPNNLDVRHTITFAGTYTHKNLKMGIGVNYRTGKPFTQPVRVNPLDTNFFPARINYESPNSSRLPEYIRVDTSAYYNFDISRGTKATIGVSLLNLTNRQNLLNRYYRLSDTNEIETVQNVSLGITPNVSFRVSF
ncbi:MAG: carboxypeptidase-like regulatory domain-containing protein [Flavobacteriaceae bacterium]